MRSAEFHLTKAPFSWLLFTFTEAQMAKKLSESSRPEKLKKVSADYIFNKPLTEKQKGVLRRIKAKQDADDDSSIDFSDIPPLTNEQLATARRPARKLVAARLDSDVMEWLQSFGPGYSTRINSILRAVMEQDRSRHSPRKVSGE
jgi:uncharacterized protein (DUF4415 family)